MRVAANQSYLLYKTSCWKIPEQIAVDVYFHAIWFRIHETDTVMEKKYDIV